MLNKIADCLANPQEIKQNQLTTLAIAMTRKELLEIDKQYQVATGNILVQTLNKSKEPHWTLFELLLTDPRDLQLLTFQYANLQRFQPYNYFILALYDCQDIQRRFYLEAHR